MLCQLEAGVHGLTFQGEHAEDETLEGFDAEGELAQGQGALVAKAALAETSEVVFGCVLGSVDDAEMLPATNLDAWWARPR